jgi:tetratricopeptide (TPR) repeat protein
MGAAPPDGADLARQANATFARGKYAEALALYEQAEAAATDPGLIAFNKGATLYRLGRWREAQLCYLRCLEDQEAPAARRARALYDLGNCLLRDGAQAEDAKTLQLAVKFYRACLNDPAGAELRGQAEHNLELARLLWRKARDRRPDRNPDDNQGDAPKKQEPEGRADGKEEESGDAQTGKPAGKKTALERALQDQAKAKEVQEQVAGAGMRPLADTDQLMALDSHDTAALLEQAAQRILREQLARRERAALLRGTYPNVKDW